MKIICHVHGGGSISFKGTDAITVFNFLSDYTHADLEDENVDVLIADDMHIEKTKDKVTIT